MPIVSSTFTAGHAQANGARYVAERHTWDDGSVTELEYGPIRTDKADLQAIAEARARQFEEARATQDADAQERAAAEAKVATVLDEAVKSGALTDEELSKLGLLDQKKLAQKEVSELEVAR